VSVDDARRVAPIFDPARLELARKYRGFTKAELAEEIGVSAAAVSQYELGYAKPSAAVVAKLSLSLSFPLQWFSQGRPVVRVDTAGAHFRSLRTTSQREREHAFAQAEFTWEIAQALERRVRLPVLHLRPTKQPADAEDPVIEQFAGQVRKAWDLGRGPIPNMVRLLESRGIIVTRLSADTRRVDAFSYPFPTRPVIVLADDKANKARSRFDAAHELGHLLMHSDAEPGNRVLEQQAHTFAAAFLMPGEDMASELPSKLDWPTFLRLKQTWGVSIAALLYRARTLGIISEPTYRRAITYMSKRNWRSEEPGDLGPAEQPTLMRKALGLLASRNYTFYDLADATSLPVDIITLIAALQDDDRPAVQVDEGATDPSLPTIGHSTHEAQVLDLPSRRRRNSN
jgi:Zn-dependent peptidase ImmA (M78 family)/DNA-binding XRE family transcriptional regulator